MMKGLLRLGFFGLAGIIAAALLVQGQALAATTTSGLATPSQGFARGGEEGQQIFAEKCAACHGAGRDRIPKANLGSADFLTSKGDATLINSITNGKGGMPAWGKTLSQEEITAVVAYLKAAAAGAAPAEGKQPGGASSTTLTLSATNGVPALLQATLKDAEQKPVPRAVIQFAALSDFMPGTRPPDAALAPMVLGQIKTDAKGVARLEFTPHQEGDIQLLASYEGSNLYRPAQAKAVITVAPGQEEGYVPQAGIRPLVPLQPPGAPTTHAIASQAGLSFPISASWGIALLMGGIWSTFFIVAYQVMGIGLSASLGSALSRRLVPLFILGFVVALGSTLIWMVLTSPYTHHHLGPPPVPWPAMEDVH